MQRYQSLDDVSLENTWLAIGSFDGVHLGHQEILTRMVTGAHSTGATPAVLTFFPHPAEVLRGLKGPFYLTSPDEKAALLAAEGVEAVISLTFDRALADKPAADFMESLSRYLGLRRLWVGYNFTLGRNREGDIPTLQRLGSLLGYEVEVVQPVTVAGTTVSSSQIRALLYRGEVDRAAELLGRLYSVEGKVVPGDGRGRTIGIPTANLEIWEARLLPAPGVYAVWGWVGDRRLAGVANIGRRPTFEDQAPSDRLEVYLLGYSGDLYGQPLEVEFVRRLRSEQRFASVEALVDQIHQDIQQTQGLLPHEP